jgi:hypothetical protein
MANIAQAPVQFSSYTTLSGTSVQIIPVNAAGVLAGLASGNFPLISPQSDLLNGERFKVNFGGWVKAHGTSQTFAVGLYCNPYTSSTAPTGNGTLTSATATASGTLTAGTFYDFVFSQEFFGDANANTLTCLTPSVYIAGATLSQAQLSTPIAVTFASASQTSPITGVNTTYDWPLANFYVGVTNSVSDTTETLQLTEFYISQA